LKYGKSVNKVISMIDTITQIIIWTVVFLSLYISVVWLSFLYLYEPAQRKKQVFPYVTIAIPAYDEQGSIGSTIRSVAALDYPHDKLEIIVVNDGSADKTKDVVKKTICSIKGAMIRLVSQENLGKGTALNSALRLAKGELFGVVDADSFVKRDALKFMVCNFSDENTAAVISALQVNNPKNIYEKVQRLEYIIGILTRRLMAFIGTLAITPGVLSLYRTRVLRELDGFDPESKTEDFEIAMKLKYYGYDIEIEKDAYTYTNVPNNFKALWNQRIRWFRGFIENHIRYKKMFFDREHSSFGWFQLPLNMTGILILIAAVAVMLYGISTYLHDHIERFLLIDGYFTTFILGFTTSPKDFLLGLNMKIMLPIYIALGISMILFYAAHRSVQTKVKYPGSIFAYFFIMPIIYFVHWIASIGQEAIRMKKKW